MCVYKTKSAKSINCDAYALEVRKLNAAVVAHHYVFDVTAAIDKRPNLSSGFVRKLGQLASKLRRHDLMRRNTPGVKLRYPAKLICFQTRSVS
jgi:hypothetical protein